MTPEYRLLALCARPRCEPADCERIREAAVQVEDWAMLPELAEAQAVAPLLRRHLRAAGVEPPARCARTLGALERRHQRAHEIRTRVLCDVLGEFRSAGIEVRLLKGAALAHLVYEQPGLRPMRDIDLYVPSGSARAAALLADLGFVSQPTAQDGALPAQHLPPANLQVDGLTVSVEVHHNLDYGLGRRVGDPADLMTGGLRVDLGGVQARTLGCEQTLRHICVHVRYILQEFRLIWVADLLGVAGTFLSRIDWGRLRKESPEVLATLSLFHCMAPLPEALRPHVDPGPSRTPGGTGCDFTGWPRSGSIWRERRPWPVLVRETFFPSEWWLRLHYALGPGHPLFWHRWLLHPLNILRVGWRKLPERVGGRRV